MEPALDPGPATAARPPFPAALRRLPIGELVRFGLVGGSGLLVNLAVYTLLLRLGWSVTPAGALAFTVALGSNYYLNRRFTFREAAPGCPWRGVLRFSAVGLVVLAPNLALLNLFVLVGVSKVLAQVFAVWGVWPLSFTASRRLAFAH